MISSNASTLSHSGHDAAERSNATASALFTVSRIAKLLGVDRKTVREHFAEADQSLSRTVITAGQKAQGWPLAAIPPRILVRLDKCARDQGYDDVERFLAHARQRWLPRLPFGQIPQAAIDNARQRCGVFAPVLRDAASAPIAELVRTAKKAWDNGARYAVADRTLRRWLERALERDRGFSDWNRWEIYLDEDLSPAAAVAKTDAAEFLELPRLAEALGAVKTPANPTSEERRRIWIQAFKDVDALDGRSNTAEDVQRAVILAIATSGIPIAKNEHALRKMYSRKREAWENADRSSTALADRRAEANAARRFKLSAADRLILLRLALEHDGRFAEAWREAIRKQRLSPDLLTRFSTPADKSHVPHSVRREIERDLAQVMQRKLGPRSARLKGPYTERDWSDIEPGDWWVGDDLTPPVYWWEETAEGPVLMRGQILMLCDAKTDYALGWVLLSSRSYNSRAIRSLITRCHDEHALPRKGFLFEHGIWENSKILTGGKDPQAVEWEVTEEGLREFKLDFQFANTPGQKTIERVYGLLQNRMETLPGYCGRDERRDCPEITRRHINDVLQGREHPSKYFLEKQQFAAEIEKIIAEHAAEKYGARSRKIPNLAPAEAYNARRTEDLVHLKDGARYLLANHRVPVKVGRNGIRLRSSLGGGVYRNEQTGSLIGQEVLAWVDVDAPAVITITTLDRKNPILVERAPEPKAIGATGPELGAEVLSRRSHARYGDALYRVVAGAGKTRFRSLVVDRASAQLGIEMATRQQARKAAKTESLSLSAEFDRLTRNRGLVLPKPSDPERLRKAVERLRSMDTALTASPNER